VNVITEIMTSDWLLDFLRLCALKGLKSHDIESWWCPCIGIKSKLWANNSCPVLEIRFCIFCKKIHFAGLICLPVFSGTDKQANRSNRCSCASNCLRTWLGSWNWSLYCY